MIAIPSYRREIMIQSMTLALLERQGIPRGQVYIFVADADEHRRYRAKLGDRWPNIVTGVPGLWRQRNFITDFFPEGQHVVSLDDDVEEILRMHGHPTVRGALQPLHAGGLVDIIKDARQKMQRFGLFLWSLNVSDNPYFMGNAEYHCALTLRTGLCNGFFWGCLNRKTPELRLLSGDGHEDVERTCRYVQKDGAVFRYREFCAKTKCQSNAGGLQASLTAKQRKLEEDRGANSLADEFPLLLRRAPDSKLGVKFISSTRGILQRYCILSAQDFAKLATWKRLNLLLQSQCVLAHEEGHGCLLTPCTLEALDGDLEVMGLAARDGRRLCVPFRNFAEALKAETAFVVWMPTGACQELGLRGAKGLDELPEFLHARATAAPPRLAGRPGSPEPARSSAEQSHFASYLGALVPGVGPEPEDGDGAAGDAAAEEAAPAQKGTPNVDRKRSSRHEDAQWVRSQSALLLRAAPEAGQPAPERSASLFKDFEIHDGFEERFAALRSEEGQRRPALAGRAAPSSVLCASRIWAGGWGGQCTHSPLLGAEYCNQHSREIARQGYLTHGRFDGDIPPKKRKEFEKWQAILRGRDSSIHRVAGSAAAARSTLGDSGSFCEEEWRSAGRGAGESDRAFEHRTGIKVNRDAKQKSQTTPSREVQRDGKQKRQTTPAREAQRDGRQKRQATLAHKAPSTAQGAAGARASVRP